MSFIDNPEIKTNNGVEVPKDYDQLTCPICGRPWDCMEPAVHMDARGPSYSYCACNHCQKAWELGQFRRMDTTISIREVQY